MAKYLNVFGIKKMKEKLLERSKDILPTRFKKRSAGAVGFLTHAWGRITPDSYTKTPIRFLVEMKLFRSQ